MNTMNVNIQGSILKFSTSSSFLSKRSQNKATVIIVQEINTVPYHSIADQIIRQIHHHIKVVRDIAISGLSFLKAAYGNAIINKIYSITQINHISV
jgi:hypothetical protein